MSKDEIQITPNKEKNETKKFKVPIFATLL